MTRAVSLMSDGVRSALLSSYSQHLSIPRISNASVLTIARINYRKHATVSGSEEYNEDARVKWTVTVV